MDRDYRTRRGKGIRVGKEIGQGIESATLFSPGSKYVLYIYITVHAVFQSGCAFQS